MPYHHQDLRHTAEGPWDLDQLVRAGRRDHVYGYGGVSYSGSGAVARFGTDERGPVGGRVSRFELWYRQTTRGGRVDLRVDDGERVALSTRAETEQDAWHVIDVPDGPHRLELRAIGGGDMQLFGMVLEREGPGVVYDSLGMVGARARRMLGLDPQHFHTQLEHRQTNLVVLAFGGNDADDVNRTAEQFEDDFRRVIRLTRRARPEAGCLLMAPLDQAVRDDRGNIITMSQVPVIVAAQRRAAQAEGCAFFDTYEAMGGEGSMRRWFRSNPRLAFGDFRHATPGGYRVIGNMLYRAILKGFSDFLATQ
ncbi:MAG: GDSL-type esterase/lipase family protein [Sandaracinaceae bacterium]